MYTPIKLVPVTKSIIWGGTRLSRDFGIGKSGEKIAEAWELTCRNDGDNVIIGGAYDGMKLSEFIEKYPDTVSDTYKSGERFPLLIKLIDAERDFPYRFILTTGTRTSTPTTTVKRSSGISRMLTKTRK